MKRSELNKIIENAIAFIEEMRFPLPPFAYWSPGEWALHNGAEYKELRDNMLGWDITDFGSGDFEQTGLLMFTLRNGNLQMPEYPKPYAEKLLITEENQVTPLHFHWNKMEDIINRGGGNILLKIYESNEDESLSDKKVRISRDGHNYFDDPGTVVTLHPGESITLFPGQYHEFWGMPGSGKTMLSEVSKVNNDWNDNRFYGEIGRFPRVTEDENTRYPLFNEV